MADNVKHYVLATQQPWGVEVFRRCPVGFICVDGNDRYDYDYLGDVVWALRLRYAFFLNWSAFVPADILALAECVNFHCTALPYGRGGGPIENLLLRGHTETVITAHRMVEELDAGPIYGMRGPVSLAGTKAEILDRFVQPCVDLIRWIVETEPVPYPQVGDVVNFARLPKAEYEAFWKGRS